MTDFLELNPEDWIYIALRGILSYMSDQIIEESENSFLKYANEQNPVNSLLRIHRTGEEELEDADCQIIHDAREYLIDSLKTDDDELRTALSWNQFHAINRFQDLLFKSALESDEDYLQLGEIFDEND